MSLLDQHSWERRADVFVAAVKQIGVELGRMADAYERLVELEEAEGGKQA